MGTIASSFNGGKKYAGHLVFMRLMTGSWQTQRCRSFSFCENNSRQFSRWKEICRSFSFSVVIERLPVMQTLPFFETLIDDLQCFWFCRKFDAFALRGRPDQNKYCGSRHPFVSTAQRKCQTFAVSMVEVIKEQRIVS